MSDSMEIDKARIIEEFDLNDHKWKGLVSVHCQVFEKAVIATVRIGEKKPYEQYLLPFNTQSDPFFLKREEIVSMFLNEYDGEKVKFLLEVFSWVEEGVKHHFLFKRP